MGVSTSAKLIFGAKYEELAELENLNEMLDDSELSSASPWYDSDRDNWIVGVELPSELAGEAEMVAAIRAARIEFERLTGGMLGRIIVAPDVT
jgi:hypothetical protein